MKNFVIRFIVILIGSRLAYRFGRALYQNGLGDVKNDMSINGESLIQQYAVNSWLISESIPRELIVFDVGANIGDWSLKLINCFNGHEYLRYLKVYMFEPTPSTFELLKSKFEKSHPMFHYEQVALSNQGGKGSIFVKGVGAGTNSLHTSSIEACTEELPIEKITLTDFCNLNNIENIHLLKCDTEGHDMQVIRGALTMLSQGRIKVFQFEYNYRWIYARNFLRDVFIATLGMNYKLVKLHTDYLLAIDDWHPEIEKFFEGNYALILIDELKYFPCRRASWDQSNAMLVDSK